MIRTSWERCEQRGLPIGQLSVPSTSSFDSDTRLGHSAQPVLRTLHNHLSNEPISIMLSDETGLGITRLCNDRAIVRSLDEVALAPGSTYSEPAVGTNGFGLALATNAPALVAGDDHDSTRLTGYTCAGVPIHDPVDGTLIGALSLTTWSTQRTDLPLALAGQTAMNIEARLSVGSTRAPVRRARCPPAVALPARHRGGQHGKVSPFPFRDHRTRCHCRRTRPAQRCRRRCG